VTGNVLEHFVQQPAVLWVLGRVWWHWEIPFQ
jgi:hypothetical protein